MVIQGTAADIMKVAMVRAHGALAAECCAPAWFCRSMTSCSSKARPRRPSRCAPLAIREMEAAYAMDPPLAVEAGIGTTRSLRSKSRAPRGKPRLHRPVEAVALDGVAAELRRCIPGGFVLDALGDHLQVEAMGELDRRVDDRLVGSSRHMLVTDERSILTRLPANAAGVSATNRRSRNHPARPQLRDRPGARHLADRCPGWRGSNFR